MFRLPLIAATLLIPSLLRASDVQLTCTFETLPSFVIFYDSDVKPEHTISVKNRPPAPLISGSGFNRLESASVDGYSFVFAPRTSSLTVHKGEDLIGTETGSCVTIGGPANETPLGLPAIVETETPANQTTEDPKNTGDWSVEISESNFDDTAKAILSLTSTKTVRGRFGGTTSPKLYLRCEENTTSLFMFAGGHFLSDIQGYGRVDYRIDGKKAGQKNMKASTSNEALGLWSGGQAIPFIKEIMSGQTLLVRLTPYNESSLEFSFNINGLSEAVKPLRKACNW